MFSFATKFFLAQQAKQIHTRGTFMDTLKRISALLTVVAVFLAYQPLLLAGARAQTAGEISGTAVVEGKPLASITVRLRNVDNGQLVGTTTTNEKGEFKFTGLPVGNYVVETIARDGSTLLGTSTR